VLNKLKLKIIGKNKEHLKEMVVVKVVGLIKVEADVRLLRKLVKAGSK